MTTTTTTTTGPVHISSRAAVRAAGAGGFVFATTVILQNILRGGSAPANDAAPAELIEHFTNDRTLEWLLVGLFAIGAVGLAAFAGALWTRLRDGEGQVFVRIGVLGVAALTALFTTMVGSEVALMTYVETGTPDPEVVRALWVSHNATFAVLLVAIAIALAGLGTAASASGLIGPAWRRLSLFGAALLVTATAAAPAVAEGSAFMAVGGVGFVLWLAFVVRTSYALVRAES